MRANYSKSYFPYLNNLVDQYNNTYHHSITKNPINADCSVLTEKNETNSKAPNLKKNKSLTIRIFLVKVILKIGQEKYLFSILF